MCFWFFFCKQKTAYEMRISDWSSDVCSSDLIAHLVETVGPDQFQRVDDVAERLRDFLALVGPPAVREDPLRRLQPGPQQEGRPVHGMEAKDKIGRASCRERVCQYV